MVEVMNWKAEFGQSCGSEEIKQEFYKFLNVLCGDAHGHILLARHVE